MERKYAPLELALIEEGQFIDRINSDLSHIQQDLLSFVEEHADRAKGAKAVLTIQITLACENPTDGGYSIKALTKKTVPNRPASVSLCFGDEKDDGTPSLFVRKSGSDESIPQQGKLATDAGKTIDQETGEVLPG